VLNSSGEEVLTYLNIIIAPLSRGNTESKLNSPRQRNCNRPLQIEHVNHPY